MKIQISYNSHEYIEKYFHNDSSQKLLGLRILQSNY